MALICKLQPHVTTCTLLQAVLLKVTGTLTVDEYKRGDGKASSLVLSLLKAQFSSYSAGL